jgi:hypothetical protein
MLANIGWNPLNGGEVLWIKNLEATYLKSNDLLSHIPSSSSSATGKGIVKQLCL